MNNKIQSEKPDMVRVSKKDIENHLKAFEKKYHMPSDVFYRQVQAGVLEEREEYITWLGYYEAYQRF